MNSEGGPKIKLKALSSYWSHFTNSSSSLHTQDCRAGRCPVPRGCEKVGPSQWQLI